MNAIYTPAGAALEYAPLAVNLYRGCSHGCRYCYAPACLRMSREAFAKPEPRRGIIAALARDMQRIDPATGPVLLSFTSDPYQPAETDFHLTREAIDILRRWGWRVRLLTKAPRRALNLDGPLLTEAGVEFGVSLVWEDDKYRAYWEPGAEAVAERLWALNEAERLGLKTWVSIEPVIDPEQALDLIEELDGRADTIYAGKICHQPELERAVDWPTFCREAQSALMHTGARWRIKDSLWQFASIRTRAMGQEGDGDGR